MRKSNTKKPFGSNKQENTKRTVVADKKKNKVQLKATKTIILKTFKVSKEHLLLEFLYTHITNERLRSVYLKTFPRQKEKVDKEN